ncbi:MAG: aminotransferase class V-fold PLP-dependent enzyme, partial [Clostridia bacterium]|nr:aminotransferase class V-fold PLP-dependent enzyme [Clostridia bacterium]
MIYLDNAATTRPNETAVAQANKYLTEEYFNPSARYHGGATVHSEIERAREFLTAQIASCDKFSLVFTSCGTEADNQAVFTAAKRGNAVTDSGEHSAIYKSFTELKNRGVEPRFAPVLKDGRVDCDALLSLVDEKTSLVSVVHVNNETGAINDINEIARRVKEKNPRTVFHSDGVQAYGKIRVRLTEYVDLYSLSAHKIGGLKGTGALIRRKKFPLQAFLFGGGQEGELRSGTEN